MDTAKSGLIWAANKAQSQHNFAIDLSNRVVYSSMIFDFFPHTSSFQICQALGPLILLKEHTPLVGLVSIVGHSIGKQSYTLKNAQLVSSLQTSCHKSVHKLLQVCSQAVNKFSLHCLLPVVATSLEQAVNCNF